MFFVPKRTQDKAGVPMALILTTGSITQFKWLVIIHCCNCCDGGRCLLMTEATLTSVCKSICSTESCAVNLQSLPSLTPCSFRLSQRRWSKIILFSVPCCVFDFSRNSGLSLSASFLSFGIQLRSPSCCIKLFRSVWWLQESAR